MAKIIILVAFLSVVIFLIFKTFFSAAPAGTVTVDLKGREYNLEVAKTIGQKAHGLMNRTSLQENSGMIFVSAGETPQVFWMKNTLIPLDMVFLDKTGKVINIETAYPEPEVPDLQLKLYRSLSPAKYVIELLAGTAQKIKLLPGDRIRLPRL